MNPQDLKAKLDKWLSPYQDLLRDRAFLRMLEEECVLLWRSKPIRVASGELKETLTDARSNNRNIKSTNNSVIFSLFHPALKAHPEYVPDIDFYRAFEAAFERYKKEKRG